MEIAVKALFFLGLNPKLTNHKRTLGVLTPKFSCKTAFFSNQTRCQNQGCWRRENHRRYPSVSAVLSEEVGVSSSQFNDFSVVTARTDKAGEVKISVEVSSDGTRLIYDNVFGKMVAASQPIPGFRRVKGGETPDVPKEFLLEILGPSKVYKQVIKKVINSTIAEYVEKEGLKVSKDLRVEQSYEDLEDAFKPGEKFSFDAFVQLQETN